MLRYCLIFACLLTVLVSYIYLNRRISSDDDRKLPSTALINTIQLVLYENRTNHPQSNGASLSPIRKDRTNVHVPKFMLELYENNKYNGNDRSKVPEVVRSVIPKSGDVAIDEHYQRYDGHQDNHLLVFDVPDGSEDEVFLKAELKILTLIDGNEGDAKARGVERLIELSVYDETRGDYFHVDDPRLLRAANNTWITFNLTETVQNILTQSTCSRALKVVVSIKHVHVDGPIDAGTTRSFRLSLMPDAATKVEHDYPVLLLSYDVIAQEIAARRQPRRKRNAEEDYEEETNRIWDDGKREYGKRLKRVRNACRRKPLYVNFSEINYDTWIVQPRGYEAYQCQGKCFYPVAEHLSPTKHAIVQSLLHSLSPSKAMRSCCVPTKLASISVLYIDHNGVLTYRLAYQDMVVTECGCR